MEKPPPEAVPMEQGQCYPPPHTGAPPPTGYAQPQTGYAPPPAGYAQPQAGYPSPQAVPYQSQPVAAPPPASNTTVVMANTQPATMPPPAQYRDQSVSMTCRNCKAQIHTRIRHEIGMFAIIIAVALFFFGCWPCCIIPLFVEQCKDVHHECPNCNVELGTFKRL